MSIEFLEFTGSTVECKECHAAVPVSSLTSHVEWHEELLKALRRAAMTAAVRVRMI